ncbi:MAG: hypothetical protein B0D92_06720 [Spirochaeta sp. LUC14_002_19_P3]|nr:MAG: hypothetical protein B0D92_06720 [Spirochaeta sp. LUC14_002_19_P3]
MDFYKKGFFNRLLILVLIFCVFSAGMGFAQSAGSRRGVLTLGTRNAQPGVKVKYEVALGDFIGLAFGGYLSADAITKTSEIGLEVATRFYLGKTLGSLEGFYLGVPVAFDMIGIFGDQVDGNHILGGVAGASVGYQWLFLDKRAVFNIEAGGLVGYYGKSISFMFANIPGNALYFRWPLFENIMFTPYFSLNLGIAF